MQVLILGALDVVGDDGARVPLAGAKIRALTALLALDAGRVVSTDRLIDGIYGDDRPQQAGNALQLLVSKLRTALRTTGAGADRRVVTRPPGYLLDVAPDDVDALRFARLVAAARAATASSPAEASPLLHQALALWRGPALADFACEDFVTGERVRLEELRRSATEDCMDADLALGRHVECVDQLEGFVAANPLRERAWGQLMVALYRAGRQAEALRAFQQARQHLGDELGIDPGPDLCRLEAAVLAQDPALAAPTPAPVVTSAAGAASSAARRALDRPLTACIGRDTELAAVDRLLDEHRLVTLVGPGGTGKTRLAIEVALTRADAAGGGACLIDLAPATDAQGVLAAVRAALGQQALVPDAPSRDLPDGTALVVLDNCEQVILEAAHAAADLVSAYPRLRVLATSREGLGVPGEILYSVPPLDQRAAVRLFAERAQAASPGLDLDDRSCAAVAEICVRLDGLPLAIELAAARARALDVTQIAARLNDRFQLLTAGPRTLLPRQRTLRAVVDWSYDLLEPGERILFERLSVFAGSARLGSVEAVCAGDGISVPDVADLLARLVDKSLVLVARTPSGIRFSMLQTLAEYAHARLVEGGLADAMRHRHLVWAMDLAERAERGAGANPSVSLSELDAEVGELESALTWARAHDPGLAFELAGRLGWFWFWTGRIDSGWQTLSACLAAEVDAPAELRSRARAWGAMLGRVMQAGEAAALIDTAVADGRASGEPGPLGQTLVIRAALAVLRGNAAAAGPDVREAAACSAATGDLHGQGVAEMVQGMVAIAEGRTADAEGCYRRSVDHFRTAGEDWAAGVSLHRLADLGRSRTPDQAEPVEAEPSRFYQALIRAQLASARMGTGSRVPAADAASSDQTHDLAVAVADHIRGRITLRGNRPEDARTDLELALRGYRAQGNLAAVSTCLGDLGRLAGALQDRDAAVRWHAEATQAAILTTDQAVVLSAIDGLSAALSASGQGRRAGVALGAADILREAGFRNWDPDADHRAVTAATAALVGDHVLDEARREGRRGRIEDLLDSLLA